MNITLIIWLTILTIMIQGSYEIHLIFQSKNRQLYEEFSRKWRELEDGDGKKGKSSSN